MNALTTFFLFITAFPLAVSALLLLVDMVWVFLVALYLRNNSIVDVAYGLAFILVSATILFNFGPSSLGALITTVVSIWGLRLAIRIHERNRHKGEDFRYAAWREEWTWVKTRSFFQIFMLQGFIVFLISTPIVLAISNTAPAFSTVTVVGLLVWLVGFFFETVGDYQLDQFIKNPSNKGKLLETGLWSLTRHPNYFGEATMWWGIWLMALPAIMPMGWGIVFVTWLISPALITYFLLNISGVPMLEQAMQKKSGWESYAKRVSVFVPWFPKQ